MTIEELKKEIEKTEKEIKEKQNYLKELKLRNLKRDLLEYSEINDVVFGEIIIMKEILEIWNSIENKK